MPGTIDNGDAADEDEARTLCTAVLTPGSSLYQGDDWIVTNVIDGLIWRHDPRARRSTPLPELQHLLPVLGIIAVMAGVTIAKLGEIAEDRWGLFTTAQALDAGVSRKTLSTLTSSGAIERVIHGVYRITGAPRHPLEHIHAPWLALGGATRPNTDGQPPVVIAGEAAAVCHDIGDFFPDAVDIITPTRRTTRLPGIRIRTRRLTPTDITLVDGLTALTTEATIADLIANYTDRSLTTDALADAHHQGKLLSPKRLAAHLDPIAHLHHAESGRALAAELLTEAGIDTTALT